MTISVGIGSKIFYSVASLIAIGLFWLKYIEPFSPTKNPFDPVIFTSPINILTSLWGALITWVIVFIIIFNIERIYGKIKREVSS